MKTKFAMLAAVAFAAVSAMPASAAIINAPVPVANYITFGGNDWAWAMPCPAANQGGCGSNPVLDLSYQGPLGWRLPTLAELAAGPSAADFGSASNFKCASAYFNATYTHCDYSDAASGAVYGKPGLGGSWYAETWVIRSGAVPEPATWAMMIGGFALVGASMRRRRTSVAFA